MLVCALMQIILLTGLCKWVRAMEVYERVAKVVAPKKIRLAAAEAELSEQMKKLAAKRYELKQVRHFLAWLLVQFSSKATVKVCRWS